MSAYNVRWGVVGLGGIAKRFLAVRLRPSPFREARKTAS
jgi:predicted dehydrogenase